MALKLAKRLFPLFLIFSFLLSGVSPALAAEISSESEVTNESLSESSETEELSTKKVFPIQNPFLPTFLHHHRL